MPNKKPLKIRRSYTAMVWTDLFKRTLIKLNSSLLATLDYEVVDYMNESNKLSPEEAAYRYVEIQKEKAARKKAIHGPRS